MSPFATTRPVVFETLSRDPGSLARAGLLTTPHGSIETPVFMPVGTQATVKGLTPDQILATGTRMILANTYHLALRPSESVVAALGGLHRFMAWDGPILTDSGGFQVFSLSERTKMTETGVAFRSRSRRKPARPDARTRDADSARSRRGHRHVSRPLPRAPGGKNRDRRCCRSNDPLGEALQGFALAPRSSALLGIVQGGTHADLREECALALVEMDFDGYAVGGVSVGESREDVRKALEVSTPILPESKARYLMGVGRPQDILDAVACGIDMFDCVLPTRNGRNATCLTDFGPVKLRNATYRLDPRPIEEGCDCLACRKFSRSYLRHLFIAKEMLGPILASIHNVAYLQRLTWKIREAICGGRFVQLRAELLEALGP